MLLNLSNHPSTKWPENQKQAAIEKYGSIQDLSFPQIDPQAGKDEVIALANDYMTQIEEINPTAVHIMGEMVFTYQIVSLLKEKGIPCIASTTERIAEEMEDGKKLMTFKFVRFRDY